VRAGSEHVYHLYVIQTAYREELRHHLADMGIETAVHYPTALPLLPAYSRLGVTEELIPRAARTQRRILSLPIYPELTDAMVAYVVSGIREFFASRQRDTART
jgi:dTDP-4-amino-4,6-dideoxygalactose transaminase